MPAKETSLKLTATKVYTISAKDSTKVIEAAGEGREAIYLAEAGAAKEQQWQFKKEGRFYKIINKGTGKCLDVEMGGTDNGTRLHQWEFAGGDNQLWFLEEIGENLVRIKSKQTGKCLDIVDMAKCDGAQLQIWDDVAGDNQAWLITDVTPAKKTVTRTSKTASKTAAKKPAAKKAPAKKPAAKKPAAKKAAPKTEEK